MLGWDRGNLMTIAIRKLIIPVTQRKIFQGQSVNILAQIVDSGVTDTLLDPLSLPTLTVFDPVNLAITTESSMLKISTGLYAFTQGTNSTNPIGTYTASFTVFNNTDAARITGTSIFDIIQTSTFLTVFTDLSVLEIKDQSNVSHFWYIARGQLLVNQLTSPTVDGFRTVSVTPAIVPYWLEIEAFNDSTPMFMYPHTTGELIIIDTSAPAIGTGFDVGTGLLMASLDTNSYFIKAHSGGFHVIEL